jgi:ribosomal protein S18 acetylase RimI-like enzyme
MLNYRTSTTYAIMIEANLIDRARNFALLPGGKINGPDPLWYTTECTLPECNGVLQANFGVKEIDRRIEEALALFNEENLPVTWYVGPSTTPQNLGKYLQKHGCTHDLELLGMAVNLEKLAKFKGELLDTGLEFKEVESKKDLKKWFEILSSSLMLSQKEAELRFEMYEAVSLTSETLWRHYLGLRDGKVVGISSLFFGADVPGFYNLTTRSDYRKQGVGTFMTVHTFAEAQKMGYEVGTLLTNYPEALRLYHRLGFEVYCKIGMYQYDPK